MEEALAWEHLLREDGKVVENCERFFRLWDWRVDDREDCCRSM